MNCIFSRRVSVSILNHRINHIFVNNSSLIPITLQQKTFLHSSSLYSQLTKEQSNETNVQVVEGLPVAATQVQRRISAQEAKKIAYRTVDWLPFKWTMPDKFKQFEDSWDQVKHLEYDPSWPKPDFELSEELKTADDEVKRIFSLATANKAQVKEVIKRRWLEKIQRHPNDFDSIEVKIALKTLTVRSLFEHQKEYRRERRNGRIMFDIVIKQRNSLLNELYKLDRERFHWIVNELKLYYNRPQIGGKREFYCKKWDLRRLTKKYCADVVQEKKNAYHEELKKLQADFLKEKEETLAWIEKEEKELAKLAI